MTVLFSCLARAFISFSSWAMTVCKSLRGVYNRSTRSSSRRADVYPSIRNIAKSRSASYSGERSLFLSMIASILPFSRYDMRSLCGAPRQRAPALGWHIRWGLHIDLACTKRRRLWILLREERAWGAHTLTWPSLGRDARVGNLGISVMAPPRFSSPLWRTRTVPGAVDAPRPSRRSRPAVKD